MYNFYTNNGFKPQQSTIHLHSEIYIFGFYNKLYLNILNYFNQKPINSYKL